MNRLSRLRLETFLRCQRRFQLRYVVNLPWPAPPDEPERVVWQQRGELFHQLVAQYYLGTPVDLVDESVLPDEVRGWWRAFLSRPPAAADSELKLVETTLTVPFAGWQLLGRFDLLVKNNDTIHLFDWKTGFPRPEAALANDWQTRLYMALLWLGHKAIGIDQLPADKLTMSYWYARRPEEAVTFCFERAWHERNVAELESIISQITTRSGEEKEKVWPLTEDLQECAACGYRNYCGRQEAAALAGRVLRDVGETGLPESDEVEWEEPIREQGEELVGEDRLE